MGNQPGRGKGVTTGMVDQSRPSPVMYFGGGAGLVAAPAGLASADLALSAGAGSADTAASRSAKEVTGSLPSGTNSAAEGVGAGGAVWRVAVGGRRATIC